MKELGSLTVSAIKMNYLRVFDCLLCVSYLFAVCEL